MADRVSATITLGGALASDMLLDLAVIINDEDLSTEWDGEDFTLSQLPVDGSLTLNRLVDQPWRIMSIGLRSWAHA